MNNVCALPDVPVANPGVACTAGGVDAACLRGRLNAGELARLDSLNMRRYRVGRGGYLFRAGGELQSLFEIRSGSLKCSVMNEEGREQVMGFYLAGELLGMDAIGTGVHVCDAIALEDSEVCRIPFADLQQQSRAIPALGHNLNCMMSREIGRNYGVMLLLGSMRADERLATFLLGLSVRLRARGYSPSQLVLRMTRDEIGSFLGLKLETVSRMFSRFQREGMIAVRGKEIHLIDLDKLKSIVRGIVPLVSGALGNADDAATAVSKRASPVRAAINPRGLRPPFAQAGMAPRFVDQH